MTKDNEGRKTTRRDQAAIGDTCSKIDLIKKSLREMKEIYSVLLQSPLTKPAEVSSTARVENHDAQLFSNGR